MHPNRIFREQDRAVCLDHARREGFGLLTINGADRPLLSHVPFEISDDETTLSLHLAKNNPMRSAFPCQATLAVVPAHAYISPDWYEVVDQVPTWNYIAVHISGSCCIVEAVDLPTHLARLSEINEKRIPDKKAWALDKMKTETFEQMQRGIFMVSMEIEQVEGTFKLSQNKGDDIRQRVANKLAQSSNMQSNYLAKSMRDD